MRRWKFGGMGWDVISKEPTLNKPFFVPGKMANYVLHLVKNLI